MNVTKRRDWEVWYEEHGAALLLYARQWTSCVADAEDIVHEAFLAFWRSRRRARDPLAYLYRCVRNSARRRHREVARRTKRETLTARTRVEAFWSGAEDAEFAQTVQALVESLPEPQREVLVLKIWSGLTFSQIGSNLGVSPNTAASRYRYALDALRKTLQRRNHNA